MSQKTIELSRKDRQRYCNIVRNLSALSRNGWRDAKPFDYQPLEAELRALINRPRSPAKSFSKNNSAGDRGDR